MKPKTQRLTLLIIAAVAVLAAVVLFMWGVKDRAAYFHTPADIAAGKADASRTMRLGGMVEVGSVDKAPDGITIRFRVTDGKASTPVQFHGILPDLFKEGSGVVAEGRLQGDTFVADNILAKHDERYMPPQLGDLPAERNAGATLDR
jgi:cytochrome c-type biogenesis protein CcmE